MLKLLTISSLIGLSLAARGIMVIHNKPMRDPSGCYPVGPVRAIIENNCLWAATVFATPNCTGKVQRNLLPTESYEAAGGWSVLIP
jgi:hypothetical protein